MSKPPHRAISAYLEWTAEHDDTIGAEILKSDGVYRSQIHNISGWFLASLFARQDQGLLVDEIHEARTNAHSGFVAPLEILNNYS